MITLLTAAPSIADEVGRVEPGDRDRPTARDAADTAAVGSFLTLAATPRTDASHATMVGGYDTSRGGMIVETALHAELGTHLQLLADGSYNGPSATIEPRLALQRTLLDELHHGLDLAVTGGWEHQGFNQVPAYTARISAGRHVGATYLIATTQLGVGSGDDERYGEVDLAALCEVAPDLHAGIDSRAHLDLERGANEPAGEATWDLAAGPTVTISTGPVAITAIAAFAARQQRVAEHADLGARMMLGVGAVF